MRKYRHIYLIGLQSSLEYRVNYLTNLLSVFIPILMQYFVWSTVYAGQSADAEMFGLTYQQAIIYTLCAGLIGKLISVQVHSQISSDIKSGALNQFLVQPVRYISYQIARFFGEKTSESVVIFLLLCIFLLVVAPLLGLHAALQGFFLFLAALLPAMVLNFLLFLLISMIAFWVVEVGRLYAIINILVAIVSGNIFPLSIFGDTAGMIFRWLPFSYTTYFLTNLINGTIGFSGFWQGLIMQLCWIILLIFLCRNIWARGLHKYTAVGG